MSAFFLQGLRSPAKAILVHLCLALAAAQLIFLVGIDRTEPRTTCQVTTLLLHFFLLSAFGWMVVEAYHLYATFVIIFHQRKEYTWAKYMVVGYLLPAVIACATAGAYWDSYASYGVCWLPQKGGALWTFLVPLICALLVNGYVFVRIMANIFRVQKTGRRMSQGSSSGGSTARELKQTLKATATFFAVLGTFF